MFVIYVLPHASLCGGVKVIAEHVTGLVARGHAAEVWGLTGSFQGWFPRHVPHRLFGSTDELGASLQKTRAHKVATFWVTASWVKANLLPGEKGYYLIQDEDELTYGGSSSGTSYKLGLTHITEGQYVTEEIQRKFGVKCHNVGIGIDHAIFNALPFIRERFRVLTPARTHTGGPNNLKGWDTTQEVLRHLVTLVPQASVVTYGLENTPSLGFIPHIHLRNPTDGKLRELYSQSGVFLSCSRHEGFGLPMLEAMACGCPVVCTDAHGNREFCESAARMFTTHNPGILAHAIADVMTDTRLWKSLNEAGIAVASRYRWSRVIDNLESLFTTGVLCKS